MNENEDQAFAEWAIVEMMGHRRLAGHVREVQIAGQGFLRLDIPASGDDAPRTQYLAPASIYALHPVGEATARKVADAFRPEPVSRWDLKELEPPKTTEYADQFEDGVYASDADGGPF
jgi:hypothetical protein